MEIGSNIFSILHEFKKQHHGIKGKGRIEIMRDTRNCRRWNLKQKNPKCWRNSVDLAAPVEGMDSECFQFGTLLIEINFVPHIPQNDRQRVS